MAISILGFWEYLSIKKYGYMESHMKKNPITWNQTGISKFGICNINISRSQKTAIDIFFSKKI